MYVFDQEFDASDFQNISSFNCIRRGNDTPQNQI